MVDVARGTEIEHCLQEAYAITSKEERIWHLRLLLATLLSLGNTLVLPATTKRQGMSAFCRDYSIIPTTMRRPPYPTAMSGRYAGL